MKKKKKMKLFKASGGKKLTELGKRTSFKTVMDRISNKTYDAFLEKKGKQNAGNKGKRVKRDTTGS